MAQSRLLLDQILSDLTGVQKAYFQPPSGTQMVYPCIVYQRSSSNVLSADNIAYRFKKGYSVMVIDRDPDSLIPDQVEALPHTRFDRFYVADGLNHFVYQLFF